MRIFIPFLYTFFSYYFEINAKKINKQKTIKINQDDEDNKQDNDDDENDICDKINDDDEDDQD